MTHLTLSPLALKSEALAYRFTADVTDVESTFNRLDMMYLYHGQVSGALPFSPAETRDLKLPRNVFG